jgi:hypothetical protein
VSLFGGFANKTTAAGNTSNSVFSSGSLFGGAPLGLSTGTTPFNGTSLFGNTQPTPGGLFGNLGS